MFSWPGPGTFLAALAKRLVKVKIHNLENLEILKSPGPILIVVNHTTVVDVVVVIGSLHRLGLTVDAKCAGDCSHVRHIRPIGTSDIWDYPIARQICANCGIIPTDQFDGRAAYRTALGALANGECVLIYPEGDVKVNADRSPRQWRPGASGLIRQSGAVVIPIAQHDSHKLGHGTVVQSILRALSKVFWRPTVHLEIGKPIDTTALRELSASAREEVLAQALRDTWERAASY